MSTQIQPAISHQQKDYDGGTNVVFTNNATGTQVSVCRTDSGLIDAQGDNGKILYTGTNPDEAQSAVNNYLKK